MGASNPTVKNFLATLADYNRLSILKGVTEKFGQLMSASRGEVEMTITSATVREHPRAAPQAGDAEPY